MSSSLQLILAAVVVILGIVLIVGGIIRGRHGAVAVGVLVAGVAMNTVLTLWKKRNDRLQ
jgi:hypothetical protein